MDNTQIYRLVLDFRSGLGAAFGRSTQFSTPLTSAKIKIITAKILQG